LIFVFIELRIFYLLNDNEEKNAVKIIDVINKDMKK